MSFAKTAFYVKNVPNWERALRVLVSVAAAAFALTSASPVSTPWSWVLAASALGFSVTGLVGFCPACALVGRRLEKN